MNTLCLWILPLPPHPKNTEIFRNYGTTHQHLCYHPWFYFCVLSSLRFSYLSNAFSLLVSFAPLGMLLRLFYALSLLDIKTKGIPPVPLSPFLVSLLTAFTGRRIRWRLSSFIKLLIIWLFPVLLPGLWWVFFFFFFLFAVFKRAVKHDSKKWDICKAHMLAHTEAKKIHTHTHWRAEMKRGDRSTLWMNYLRQFRQLPPWKI